MKLAIAAHLLGVVVWVGGMFFAYLALRPAALEVLPPAQRLPLWAATFKRFFVWVWAAVVLIVGSGFYMVALIADAGRIPLYVHVMLYIGIVMTLIFAYVFFSPFPALKRAVAAQDWQEAAMALDQIRIAVAVNLTLGLANVMIAATGAG
jgi:uncharacterized membrane protein